MIDWSFRTLTLGAGFKYFYFRPHLGKMNHFDEHIFQIFSKPPTEKKQFEEANAEIGLSQGSSKGGLRMRMFRQTHRRALWKPVIHDLLGLPETQESYCQSCYDMHLNVYRWIYIYIQYIYIYIIFSQKHIDSHLVCFPKRFIYTVRLHLKTSSLFASLFGGGPATHQPGPENEWSGTEPLKPWVDVKQVNDRPPEIIYTPWN